MNVTIESSWKTMLNDEFLKHYYKELSYFIEKEYHKFSCYPPKDQIFTAFNHTPFNNIKVVIIGQDPYHGEGQANGLCFSVNNNVAIPPSLVNIFKEIETDIGKRASLNGNLEQWAKQGVLLLNAILTVRAHEAGSHQKKGWEQFTDTVISKISKEKDHVVFLLWGGYAKKKGVIIDTTKHLVLSSGHPSPLSANRGYWFGNKHFSKANTYLINKGQSPIDWQIKEEVEEL